MNIMVGNKQLLLELRINMKDTFSITESDMRILIFFIGLVVFSIGMGLQFGTPIFFVILGGGILLSTAIVIFVKALDGRNEIN